MNSECSSPHAICPSKGFHSYWGGKCFLQELIQLPYLTGSSLLPADCDKWGGAGAVCEITGGVLQCKVLLSRTEEGLYTFLAHLVQQEPKGPIQSSRRPHLYQCPAETGQWESLWFLGTRVPHSTAAPPARLVALRLLTCSSIFSSRAADCDLFLSPIAAIFMTIPSSLLDSLLSSTCQSSTLCKFTQHIPTEVTSKLQTLCTGHLCGLLPPVFQESLCQ